MHNASDAATFQNEKWSSSEKQPPTFRRVYERVYILIPKSKRQKEREVELIFERKSERERERESRKKELLLI